jgi:hypothetical protein
MYKELSIKRITLKILLAVLLFIPLILTTSYLLPATTLAVCPVCTIAVGAGLGLSRYFGIDDMVSGIWVGGLILSMSFWLVDWLDKKFTKIKESNQFVITATSIVAMYGLTILPLQAAGITGHPFNTIKLFGIAFDKLVFGSLIGSLVFLFGVWLDKKERAVKGKILFPYQKVVFPVVSLIIISLVVYFIVLPAFRG